MRCPLHGKSGSAARQFGWLWRNYLKRETWPMVLGTFFMVLEGSMLGVLSWVMLPMFDQVFVGGDRAAFAPIAFAILLIFFSRAISSLGQKLMLTKAVQRASARLRTDLLVHLMVLDTSYHQAHPPGQLIERLQGDVRNVGDQGTGVLSAIARDGIAVVWLFGVAIWIDWRWTLAAVAGIPLMILPSLFAQRFVRGTAQRARLLAGHLATRLDEVFHGINPIKLNALEKYQTKRFGALQDDMIGTEVRSAVWQAAIPALIDIMTGFGFLFVLYYGGTQIMEGSKTVGQFMSFFTAMALAFEPLRRLGVVSGMMQSAAAGIDRLRDILDRVPAIVGPLAPVAPPFGAPRIELRDVHLAFEGLPVLRGLNLVAEPGKTTALVGASGAGKSTVFNVLTRLIDPQSGEVSIGGIEASTMDLGALRGLFSVVAQDAALFDETLRENITLGRAVDPARLDAVLEAAHVADFLPRLPQGLDSSAGPRGSNLSGGQRQRVAIARALLRDTPILLLDEATSALDTRSEAIVQEALETLSQGRTTLVIAHRLSTVRSADKIVVMDRGRVVDEGTHDELLARGGIYADLYRLQFESEAAA